jgi:hypothetical protein
VGTWTLVSITIEQDGKKTDLFGPNPQGQETRAANGRVSVIITRSDLPKFASNNRAAGTPEENKAVVQGSIAYFGTSSVNETDRTITTHIEKQYVPESERGRSKSIFQHLRGRTQHDGDFSVVYWSGNRSPGLEARPVGTSTRSPAQFAQNYTGVRKLLPVSFAVNSFSNAIGAGFCI